MKKMFFLLTAALLCLSMTACQAGGRQEELSDEEVVIAFITAFQEDDYEGMQPYIDADNPLHLLFAGMEQEGVLAEAYRAVYDQVRGQITYTAQAVEGEETWGAVNITLSMPDYTSAIGTAMAEALADQVETGSTAFHDIPAWIVQAAQGEGETRQETFKLHVGSKDGNMVMDTNTNRQFFAMLCGGLRYYLKATMTTCTFPDGTEWELLAQGDKIAAMLYAESTVVGSEYAQEDLEAIAQAFVDAYSALDGVVACAGVQNGIFVARYGVDMASASTYALNNMGIISDRITAGSNGWLSLESTVSGFTRQGANCVTEDFEA